MNLITYHTGHLSVDRMRDTDLDAMALNLFARAKRNEVHLFQRRVTIKERLKNGDYKTKRCFEYLYGEIEKCIH